MNFTTDQISQIKAHGLTEAQVQSQIATFKNGVPNVQLIAAATVGDGILKLDREQEIAFIESYEHKKGALDLLKFTPASGAATRMFKTIHQFLDAYDPSVENLEGYSTRTGNREMQQFFEEWQRFPFYGEIIDLLKKEDQDLDFNKEDTVKLAFVKKMMQADGLNFGDQPKGLLPFHNYETNLATAFEEHLHEAAAYAENNGHSTLHFTVSPEHEKGFEKEFNEIHTSVSNRTNVNFKATYSFQKPQTDTVAVTLDNEPYVKPDGTMLFRPGGHGALIENLNDVDADLIFIKNIDNVLTQEHLHLLARTKMILAGVLLHLQGQAFDYMQKLDGDAMSEHELGELEQFLKEQFSTKLDTAFLSSGTQGAKATRNEKRDRLREVLNRPIRVCGMVKNVGEPGGGPFWVKDATGKTALQIIESAQVDRNDPAQVSIFKESTHFNPVDIVCGVRDYKGHKYDLSKYVDHDLAFIASKTAEGTEIKALELPGLWNGAMAFWNTTFVEVPLETFNPVKTVNDLLKPSHQVSKA